MTNIIAFFTSSGIPATGLSPTINIRNVVTTTLLVSSDPMIEVGDGFYKYDFVAYDPETDYSIRCDGTASLPAAERYVYGGNENYYDDVAHSTWTANLSAYVPGPNAAAAIVNLLYADHIHINENSPWSGTTTFAIGTKARPVNNIGDAVAIADSRFITKFLLESSVTIEADDDVSVKAFETHGVMGINVTLTAGCSADGASFRNVNIFGELSNGDTILLNDCSVGTFVGFTGIMNVVAFLDGSELTFGPWASIIEGTAGGSGGNEPEFTMDGSDVSLHRYCGNIKIMGKTGTNKVVADFIGGNIVVDSTCVSGSIQLLGMGQLEADNSGPNCNVDTEGFITTEFIADGVWDENITTHLGADSTGLILYNIGFMEAVHLDTSATPGGAGTPNDPTDTLANAVTIANTYGYKKIVLRGVITLSGDFRGWTFEGRTGFLDTIDLDNQQTLGAVFEKVGVSGVSNGGFVANGCVFNGTTSNLIVEARDCIFESGTYTFGNFNSVLKDCASNVPGTDTPIFDLDGVAGLNVRGYSGGIELRNCTAAGQNVSLDFLSGRAFLDSTNTDGTIVVRGPAIMDDQSNGSTVVNGTSAKDPDMKRALGLMHENIYIDQPTYDGDGNLVSARVRIYSVAGSVGTLNDVLAAYQISSTGDGAGRFTDWEQVQI